MNKTLTDKLRKLRGSRSQSEVCKSLGIKQSTYSTWELGKYEPPLNMLTALCEYYHVSSDYLLGLSDNPQGGSGAGTVVNGDGNAVASPAATVSSPSCRDCPHLTRLISLLAEKKGKA